MAFTCRYCGEKFCSEHRLPENHDCEKLEEGVKVEREKSDKWFQEKETKDELRPRKVRRQSVLRDAVSALTGSVTLSIILVTVLAYMLQGYPGFTDLMRLDPTVSQLLQQPWSLLTVMLVHGGAFHIFANMITFYFFGTPLERLIGGRKLLAFYIGSGLAASIGYVVFRNLLFLVYGTSLGGLPTLHPAVGASGAVVAVFAAVAMLYPRAEVLLFFVIPMQIKTALYAFAAIEGFNLAMKSIGVILPGIGLFASSAHLTGLIIGVWYGRRLRKKHKTEAGVLDLLGY